MTDLLTQFHFLRPLWLLMLIPLVVLALVAMQRQARASHWQSHIAPHLLPFLVDGKSIKLSRLPVYGLLAAWLLATFAAAGPAWQKLPQPVVKESSALVIAWDLSPSMAAQDVKPSRLVRARLKLIDLLKQRKEGLTALIAYSGEAHVVTPLTDDTDTIISLLYGLDPAIMPAKGSNAEMALSLANQLLKEGANGRGDIVFLTDGIAPAAQDAFAEIHDTAPHPISFWGIGTAQGAPIPLAGGGFAYDRDRNMVIASLDEHAMSDLAAKVGGLYVPFSATDADLKTLSAFAFGNHHADDTQQTERLFDQWYEHGPYLLLLLLPLAALAFRRGLLLCLPLCFVFSPDADALEWQDLWQTKDQQAQAMVNQDPAAAAQTFNNEKWRGIANYKAGDYQAALKNFSGDSASDYYNRGNALTQLGKYEEAIKSFEQAQKLQPENDAIKQNLAIANQLKALQEQQQQQNGDSESNDSQQDKSNNQDQQSQDGGKDQQGQQEQNQDKSSQQNAQNDGNTQQQSPEEQGSSSDQQSELSQEQQQALQDTYGKDASGEQQKQEQQQAQNQDADKAEQQLAGQPQEQDQSQNDEDSPANSVVMRQAEQQTEEQTEEQQALEQWLRKVPDDPSGLMRNKFNYEYRARKREMRENGWRQPDGSHADERW
ncbi:VWA domain-containing protein [Teredinibacter turnerae]|uniref:VWA domain-containing protein n=1 Tax=Teredinibacter turnerae TaxID=2426 RepID=UPI0005F85195|nr:VWA domain-containing protein [Teredinibacter turnerae]